MSKVVYKEKWHMMLEENKCLFSEVNVENKNMSYFLKLKLDEHFD